MKYKLCTLIFTILLLLPFAASAKNIDPDNNGSQYAWGENVGWINFEPSEGPGVEVSSSGLSGYAWGENIGWINLEPATGGVVNDGAGKLSGYAWGENVGWISFSCTDTGKCGTVNYGVFIDPTTGVFSGYAWGENIGWINFAPAGKGIKTSWRKCTDSDKDGYAVEGGSCGLVDCDDNDASINPGANELCDGKDNNCSGAIDEGFDIGTVCSAGIGACKTTGSKICAADGLSTVCNATPGAPSIEVCDNIDNDCDGSVDENLTRQTTCGVGACSGNTGIETCTAGTWGNSTCNPFAGATAEVCDDGIDNDCDGYIDALDGECINVPTPPGEDVVVNPIDSTTGEAPATITFENVTGSGTTNVTTSGTGAPPPSGFKLGQPPVYYEITTTATYGGSIIICIDYSGISFTNENRLRLFHRKDSSWVDVTSSLDTINDIICGTVSSLSPFAIFQENMTPAVGEITAPIALAPVNTPITVSATFTDPDISDTHTATWDWDDGTSSAGTVAESGGSGSVVGSHAYSVPGVYLVTLTVTDNNSGAGSSIYQYVVVYDPYGGFVTGGGWIESPQGAYTTVPSLTGKATFGFVSKYKKGATVPTGITEFQFKVANLNFHSESYEWLVVAGARAQYKGTGTINGEGTYGFMLTAIDGGIKGSGGVDKFRIKIWDKISSMIIYDNMSGASDDANPTTVISGGSIVIHKQ
jgi:hypothetical protein